MQGNSYFRLVTLKIAGMAGAGNIGTQFTFETQSDLRYARTLHLEVFFANDFAFAMPEAIPNIPDNKAALCSLVLETNDPDDIKMVGNQKSKGEMGRFTSTTQTQKWLPLTAIHRAQNQAAGSASFVRQLLAYKDLYIIWEKSYLNIAPGGLANTSDVALCLGVWYTFLDTKGREIPRT